jgi:hypothetical protein
MSVGSYFHEREKVAVGWDAFARAMSCSRAEGMGKVVMFE